jgi:uncharacterized protein
MTIKDIKQNNLLFFECVSGSRAYGLATPESDTDIKGVFVLPKGHFYSLDYIPQVNDEGNDRVYYELKRFIELLSKNNPNILELLFVDREFILHQDPLWKRVLPELFITKRCRETFAGYAVSQIKRARGLKKKIVNPVGKRKKSILEFIYVMEGVRTIPLNRWLKERAYEQSLCGLTRIPHAKNVYGLFYDKQEEYEFQGIMKHKDSMDVCLSSIPKGLQPDALVSVNIDGYSRYCKEYHEYWEWVKNRNQVRYRNTMSHGKSYDAKNMMHTFRLLDIAEEIARTGRFRTRRPNREELFAIRAGTYEYDELIQRAQARMKDIEELFLCSSLPEQVDTGKINRLLFKLREEFYTR